MNRMIAITIKPGATTAAPSVICPTRIPPPAATSTKSHARARPGFCFLMSKRA